MYSSGGKKCRSSAQTQSQQPVRSSNTARTQRRPNRRLQRYNPAAAVLTPGQWTVLRGIASRRAIPGTEAHNAAKAAWARLVEMQARALIVEKLQTSASAPTRQLLDRPDILWRINSAVHRVLETSGIVESSMPVMHAALLRCLQNVADLETYCAIWKDPLSAFLGVQEFGPIRKIAIDTVDTVLVRKISNFCSRAPGTPTLA